MVLFRFEARDRILFGMAHRVLAEHRQPVRLRHHHVELRRAESASEVRAVVGITVALILRGCFILVGAAIIQRFTWVFFLFGAFLIYTAIKLVVGGDDDEEYHENGLIRMLRKVIRITDDYDGEKLRTEKDGKSYWTPMLIVFLTIGTTDVMFAFDSIPAIFGLTKDPFIVFTSNVFALLGLQQLYFLLGALLDKLVYLPVGSRSCSASSASS